jgi:Pentapeptide repeats (8 copies)
MPAATGHGWSDWLLRQIDSLCEAPPAIKQHKTNLQQYLRQNEIAVALGGLGAAAESIVKDVLAREGWPAARSLLEDIETLGGHGKQAAARRGDRDPVAPETIYSLLHALRTYRNQLHPYKLGTTQRKDVVLQEDDRRIGLHQFLRVLEWYYVEYPRGEKMPAIRSDGPPLDGRERAWIAYTNWLDEQLDTPLFGEPFGLRQVYVPLRGYRELPRNKAEEGQAASGGRGSRKPRRLVRRLDLLVDAWRAVRNAEQPLLILEGGPGSGKSSFAKAYAAQVAREGGWRVLFVPLHDQLFDLKDNLRDALRSFCRLLPVRPPDDPLDLAAGERLLLVLDGLDEHSKTGRLGAEVVREFLDHVHKTVSQINHNRQEARLLVLLSGRPVAVEAVRTEVARTDTPIVNVLPYFVNGAQHWEAEWDDPEQVLGTDQRHAWWQKYGELTEEKLTRMPDEVASPDLEEITTLPFSNQLVAIVRRDAPERLTQGRTDLNYFYDTVLEAVYRRAWEPRNRSHPAARGMELDEFGEALEEIALTAWHSSDGRTTTERAILKRLKENAGQRFRRWLDQVKDAAAVHLLLAFFFRPQGRDEANERTFVFTHKSFAEYLTARRIVRDVADVAADLTTRRARRGGEEQALEGWAEVCGPARLTDDLLRFLKVRVRAVSAEQATAWQDVLAGLLCHVLRHGMPMEKLRLPSFQEMNRQALNSEEALLATLACCAWKTQRLSRVASPRAGEGTTLGEWLRRLAARPRGSGFNPYQCLVWMDLASANLSLLDLFQANLAGANLTGANLWGADLTRADLTGANLTGAFLDEANLTGADLTRAILTGANLHRANLTEANLTGADLTEALLTGAELTGADLTGAKPSIIWRMPGWRYRRAGSGRI